MLNLSFLAVNGERSSLRTGKSSRNATRNPPLALLALRTLDAVKINNYLFTGGDVLINILINYLAVILLVCYMNSLLQQLYMIPSFRDTILRCKDPSFEKVSTDDNVLY